MSELDNPFAVVPARPRRVRAAQAVAEVAREQAEQLKDVFRDGLSPERPFPQRLKAAQALLEVEREEARLTKDEDAAEFDAMTKQELATAIMENLASLHAAGIPLPESVQLRLLQAEVASLAAPNIIDAEVIG